MYQMREVHKLLNRGGKLLAALAFGALLSACEDKPAQAEGEAVSGAKIETRFVATPEGGFAIGAEDAPVKIIEFASFTCGYCTAFHEEVFPKLREKYIDTGIVRFEFRSFVANQIDLVATHLVECSGAEKFEALSDLFFQNLGGASEWRSLPDPVSHVTELAKRAGIPSSRYQECVEDQTARNKFLAIRMSAVNDYGLTGTPTIVINGNTQAGANVWEELDRMINEQL